MVSKKQYTIINVITDIFKRSSWLKKNITWIRVIEPELWLSCCVMNAASVAGWMYSVERYEKPIVLSAFSISCGTGSIDSVRFLESVIVANNYYDQDIISYVIIEAANRVISGYWNGSTGVDSKDM